MTENKNISETVSHQREAGPTIEKESERDNTTSVTNRIDHLILDEVDGPASTTPEGGGDDTTTIRVYLTEDVLCLIFRELSVRDLGRCATVCRAWKDALTNEDRQSMDLIWQLKLEERCWSPRMNSTKLGYRALFRNEVHEEMQLKKNLAQARFVGSCETRPWLLSGHSRRVRSMFQITDEFVVTCSEDGEIRQWRLPFETNRPEGLVVFERHDLLEKIEDVERVGLLNRLAIAGGEVVLVVHFTESDNELHSHVLQCIYSGRVSAMTVGNRVLFCGYSDGVIQSFPLMSSDASTGNNGVGSDNLPLETDKDDAILMKGHTSCVNSVILTRDDMLLSNGADQTVRFWNCTSGECIRTVAFDGTIGGPSIRGVTPNEFGVVCDTLQQCVLRICRRKDGTSTQTLRTPSRMNTVHFYERSVLCGTVDGGIVELNVDTGQQTLHLPRVVNSSVRYVSHLGKDAAIAIGEDGQMILLDLRNEIILHEMDLQMRGSLGSVLYIASKQTLLVASSGYLVRAYVFS